MLRAMERHQTKEARVIPIILRPVSWEGAPFAALQTLPADGKPVTDWPTQDKAFLDVAENIRRVVRELLAIDEARSHMAAERYDQALTAYERALQFDRRSAVAYAGKGDVLLHLGHFSKALDAYGQALQLDPTHPASESGRGVASLGLKRYQEASLAFDHAISLDPTLTTALSGKGDVLFQLHRYGEALDAYDKALRLNSDNTQLYVSRGYALEQLAQQSFEKAKQLGHSGEIHMEKVNHSRTQMQSLPMNVEKLTLVQTIILPDPDLSLTTIAMSPDGKLLAGAPGGNEPGKTFGAMLLDAERGNFVKTVGEFNGVVSCLLFSSDGQTLLSNALPYEKYQESYRPLGTDVVQAWSVKTGELTRRFRIPSNFHGSLISANEQVLVGYQHLPESNPSPSLGVFHLGARKASSWINMENPYDQSPIYASVRAVSSDGKMVVGSNFVGYNVRSYAKAAEICQQLTFWDAPTGRILYTMSDMSIPITAVAISSDKQILASGYMNGVIKLWNLSTAQLLYAFVGNGSLDNFSQSYYKELYYIQPILALTFSADGHQIVSVSGGEIKIWEIDRLP